jgi:NitT/TauT family transport system substrate-binding protein
MTRPIILYENLRTIAYAPFYLAIARGDWAAEGVEVEVRLSPEPVETAQGLLDGRADVSWGGPMRVMLHQDRDPGCPLVCFGQVVARDPFILIGPGRKRRFRMQDLAGLRVAAASEVPTPWMCFQDDLRRAGLDPAAIDRVPDAPMAENLARLAAGEVDVVQVFEPYAARAELDGIGHVWHRFAERGDLGYTSFYSTRAFVTENRSTCAALIRGVHRAVTALYTQPVRATVEAVSGWFPDLPRKVLTRAIAGYRTSGLWARSPALPAPTVVALKAALLSGGLIGRDIPYERIVDDSLWLEEEKR